MTGQAEKGLTVMAYNKYTFKKRQKELAKKKKKAEKMKRKLGKIETEDPTGEDLLPMDDSTLPE